MATFDRAGRLTGYDIRDFKTPTARGRLPVKKKFYQVPLGTGITLCLRRNEGPDSWTVKARKGWTKPLGWADGAEPPNGASVLDCDQAIDAARKAARGGDSGELASSAPITVWQAVEAFRDRLIDEGRNKGNATAVLHHLKDMPALRDKPVMLLTEADIRSFKKHVRDQGRSPATVLRTTKMLARALTLAARNDKARIRNQDAWQDLEPIRGATRARRMIITPEQVERVVREAYKINYNFGRKIELQATTGCRPSQGHRLEVDHLDVARDTVDMPSSFKGKGERPHRTLPIPHELTLRLATNRDGAEPLLVDDDGNGWGKTNTAGLWEKVAAAAGLPKKPKATKRPNGKVRHAHVTSYCLRHTFIANALMRHVPVSVIASACDTSEREIRAHYGRFILETDSAQDAMRKALPSFAAVAPAAKVLPLRARKGKA
jgi:integrase